MDSAHALALRNLIVEEIGDLFAEIRYTLSVLLGLRRESEHKVELHLGPAAVESGGNTPHDVLFRNALIDDIAKTLGPGFGRKGERTLFDILNALHDIERKSVDAQGRKRDVDFSLLGVLNQVLQKFLQVGVVTGTQRAQGNLLVAGDFQ